MSGFAASLNEDCHAGALDHGRLEQALREQGETFFRHVTEHCPHLFAGAAFFISPAQMEQMREVIAAVERVTALPAWRDAVLQQAPETARYARPAKGAFMGYDFHLDAEGAHLIEINTNAGGAFLNALMLQSQHDVAMPGEIVAAGNLEQVFLDMFRKEWRLERGDAPLATVVIVDEQPQEQYLFPDFLLAQRMFERAGITALIADPSELELRGDGLYCRELKVDLVYNRLTDFYLQQQAALAAACQNAELAVITPHPHAYALYADKYNLILLTSVNALHEMGAADADIEILQAGVPETRKVEAGEGEHWWKERKHWFFKPGSGFGGKGTYRGATVTRKAFAGVMQGGYVAQRMCPPGERVRCGTEAEAAALKADVRCYVYDGEVQLVVARLYQGQMTNFRTENGGFAQVRVVD